MVLIRSCSFDGVAEECVYMLYVVVVVGFEMCVAQESSLDTNSVLVANKHLSKWAQLDYGGTRLEWIDVMEGNSVGSML